MPLWMPDDLEADRSWRISRTTPDLTQRVGSSLDTFGFAVIQDVNTDDGGRQAIEIITPFGALLDQDAEGSKVWRVELAGAGGHTKSSKRNEALMLHNDRACGWLDLDIERVAMLAVRTGVIGGDSLIASTATVRNMMKDEFPDSYDVLTQPFAFERSSGIRKGQSQFFLSPVFDVSESDAHIGTPRNRAIEEHGLELTPEQRKALDCLDEVLFRREISLRFPLQPGELLLTDERHVLHGRTAFEDGAAESQHRLLLRFWLGRPQAS